MVSDAVCPNVTRHGGFGLACGCQLLTCVVQCMTELVGELQPGTLPDVDDNAGHGAAIGV